MAVRVINTINQITRDNAFDWTVTAVKKVSDLSPFPLLTAAANVVLCILRIVSDVKANRQGCIRLAQQAIDLLVFLQTRMEGKEDASKSLLDDIHEFEGTISSIYEYMCRLSQINPIRRGLEKVKIQDELMQHEQKLIRAEQRFQLSLSIETSYVLGVLNAASSNTPASSSVTRSGVVKRSCGHVGSPLPANAVYTEEEDFLANMSGDTDEFGFRKYHQSDVIIGNANRKAVGWFSGTSAAEVCGRKATIKKYDGRENRTLKAWVRDIKMLRNLHHGNLPQIIGYSNRKTPTPFILLASVQNRDLDLVMRSVLTTGGLADCALTILKTYRDVASAIAHAQRQLSLSEPDAHYFIDSATYGVSHDNNVIVGLPPPRKRSRTIIFRSLERSLMNFVLYNLCKHMDNETTTLQVGPCQELRLVHFNKYMHLYGFLRSLLPQGSEGLHLLPELEDLLDDAGEHSPLNFRALKAFGMHQFQFTRPLSNESLVLPFEAGDYGYFPGGSMDLANFVLLGNIQDSEYHKEIMPVIRNGECRLFIPEHDPLICPLTSPRMASSSISDKRECWRVPLPPNGSTYVRVSYNIRMNPIKYAPEFLVAHGASLASKHGIEAQDLILVTRSRRFYHYPTTAWSCLLGTRHAIELDSTASDGPASPVPVLPAETLSGPPMVYLFTSSRPEVEAYVTDEPLSAFPQHSTGSPSSHLGCHRSSQDEFVDFVRLDKEDIVS